MFIAVDMFGPKLNISALVLSRRIMIAFANNSLNNENNIADSESVIFQLYYFYLFIINKSRFSFIKN